MPSLKSLLLLAGPAAIALCLGAGARAADRPNLLWLSTEDISCHLGCYGDPVAKTPTLDALATRSLLYENAFTHAPVCSVVRSGVITGVYPVTLGTHHHRSRVTLPPGVRCFSAYLRDAGYYCTNNSKEDYNFETPADAWDESSRKAHWRNRPDTEQPFFAVFNFVGTHEGRVRGDEPAYSKVIAGLPEQQKTSPDEVVVPPYHPDTPTVRAVWARYHTTITALDRWVGERLAELEESGHADDTIVVFWSDHGASPPRGKRWLYDSGVKIPLIVHVPERFRAAAQVPAPGSRIDRLVSSIDFAPTMLSLAGVPIPEHLDGRVFLGADRPGEREHVFLHRDRMDAWGDMSRGVRTKRYKYLRHFMPWRSFAQPLGYAEASPVMQELRRLKAAGRLTPQQLAAIADEKPVEELYDLTNDPEETANLLENRSKYEGVRGRLAGRLREWMIEHRDLGLFPESELERLGEMAGGRSKIVDDLPRFGLGGESGYSVLLDSAEFVASPAPPPGDPIINLLIPFGTENPHHPLATTALVWGMRVYQRPNRLLADVPREELIAMRPEPAAARVEFAELCLRSGQAEEGVALLAEVLSGDVSGFDRLQALNVCEAIPDIQAHAEQLAPIIQQLLGEADDQTDQQAAWELRRCAEHLSNKLGQ